MGAKRLPAMEVPMPTAVDVSISLRFIVSLRAKTLQLELQFQSELNLPRVIPLAADHAEGRVAECCRRNAELDMIGDVEELGAELQVEAFAFSKIIVLEKTEIQIVQA